MYWSGSAVAGLVNNKYKMSMFFFRFDLLDTEYAIVTVGQVTVNAILQP